MKQTNQTDYAPHLQPVSRSASFRRVGLMCLCALLVNLGGIFLSSRLDLPLYFDSVGTILTAVVVGYLPSVIVGFLTNLLAAPIDPFCAYFGTINVLTAAAAAYLAQKGMFRKLPHILITIAVLAGIGGGGGFLLSWLLNGFEIEHLSSAALWLNSHTGLTVFQSSLCGNILLDLTDKAAAVLLSLAATKQFGDQMADNFRYFFGWQQVPLSKDALEKASRRYSRTISLRGKILLWIALASILIAVAATGISFMLYHRTTIEERIKLGQGVANLVSTTIDAERVDDYLSLGETADGYAETERKLYSVRDSSLDIEYIYVYRILEDGCHVVFDLDTEELAGAEPGEIIPFDESFYPYLPALLSGQPIDPVISNDSYGWLLTIYQPVYDSRGVCQCYAAADISMHQLLSNEISYLTQVVALFLSFFILVLSLGLWVAEYNITLPINTMSLAAGTFAYNSESARRGSVERIRELGIHTGDEIENLYHAFEKTTTDTVQYIEDIQEKNDEISKLQNGLIIVLADMVESRDQCTGDHIHKTAAYTEIILRQMKKDGCYPSQVTDQFIQDVVNSAPLHDIGKIQVPDAILNKPGKLTDEEYEQMKHHTIAGSEIIDRAIAIVPQDSGYLTEAKNLAAYHHERWDGKGYPYGLAGESIPLSARIMAVADVFDALVSRRSYKTPFSVDQAVSMIQDERGTHFDPIVVDAFLHAIDKVRRVAEYQEDHAAGATLPVTPTQIREKEQAS